MRLHRLSWATLAIFGAVLVGIGTWHSEAESCSHHCCVQYVYVQVPGGRDRSASDTQVHFLFILDTDDKDAGGDIALFGRPVSQELPYLLRREFLGQVEFVTGEDLTASKVLAALDRIKVAPNRDSLVVYCMLHGKEQGKDAPEEQVLQMSASEAVPAADRELTRSDLVRAIRQKNARLNVLITDSCFRSREQEGFGNLLVKRDPDGGTETVTPKYDPRTAGNRAQQAFTVEDLFVNHVGFLNINSAAPKEYAISQLFGPTFLELVKGWNSRDDAEWESFFGLLKGDVQKRFAATIDGVSATTRSRLGDQKTQTVHNFEGSAAQGATNQLFPRREKPKSAENTSSDAGPVASRSTPATASGGTLLSRRSSSTPAQVTVYAPAGTTVRVDAMALPGTGTQVFQSPPLEPGATYTYTVRAERMEGGSLVSEAKEVKVAAGQHSTVTFGQSTSPKPAEVVVKVPDGAELFVDDTQLETTANERTIKTEPLTPGRTYAWTVRIKTKGEKEASESSRKVEFKAGDKITVDFTKSETLATR